MAQELESVSPSDPKDLVGRFPVADADAVDEAVARAREAFPAWRDLGLDARAALLERFARLASEGVDELTELIAREVGKARWDAAAEARLLAPKVAVTLGDGMKLVAPQIPAAGQRATYRPRGVLAVYGPFNFPAHLPNGHIVPALATGNCVVFKPSEEAPAVGAWMAERWREAGLPEGVFSLVQGGRETGRALAAADVDGILFTGSYATGRALREATLDAPQKLLALELGGSNAMIVCADADFDLAVAEAALSIAATTGQRCTCARRLFVERPLLERFQERLVRVLRGLKIGAPFDEGVFMGPLASHAAHTHFVAGRALAAEAGGERVLEVDPGLPAPYVGAGLVRFSSLEQSHPYQREELFGPEAALYAFDTLDEAIAAANDSDYGLAASVMTREREKYQRCVGRIETGLLNWNKATVGASGRLPFGGSAKSGNDRPAGVSAPLYCTAVQAHLESDAAFDPETLPPRNAEAVSAQAALAPNDPSAERWVLMGDPSHFSVKGGANPHTRTRWGTRRAVNKERAIQQWRRLKSVLEDLGVRVLVVPPDPAWPGSVYPANAGFCFDVDSPLRAEDKRFVLSNLLPTRAGEKDLYAHVLADAGIPTEELDPPLRFEGEADLFPAGGRYLFTHGQLERQRFVPAFAIPPWKRVYGFRTDARVADVFEPKLAPKKILRIELVLEAHYHGDTALCAFGPEREHLLAYRDAIAPKDWPNLTHAFDHHLIELSTKDAQRYAANSFTYTPRDDDGNPESESFLVLPAGISDFLLHQIRERKVTPITVDVSEFLKKGGGSVKCMIGDLGIVVE